MTKFTVTLPDGVTATRNSKTMTYTHAVVCRTDRWAEADENLRLAAAFESYEIAVRAVLAEGDLTRFTRKVGSWSLAHGNDYDSYLPSAFSPIFSELAARHTSGTYRATPHSVAPSLPDWQDSASWTKYLDHSLDYMAKRAADLRTKAATLLALPQYGYAVARWSQTAANAHKAAASSEVGAREPYFLLFVVPVD